MLTTLAPALLVLGCLGLDPVQDDGPRWETSFEAAVQRAAEERKPIVLLQLFGRLDEELC